MTLLVSWVGVDPHGITSVYIAADSRVSWGDVASFDHGRKVFAFRLSPDVLGYCGEDYEGQVSTITKAFLKLRLALLPDPHNFSNRKQFPIFDPAEEVVFKKVTFSTGSLAGEEK